MKKVFAHSISELLIVVHRGMSLIGLIMYKNSDHDCMNLSL